MIGCLRTCALALVFVSLGVASHATAGELPLSRPLTNELNLLLRTSDSLHRSLVRQNDEQIELSLRDMLWQIERVRMALPYSKPHERRHLARIIMSARENFEQTQTAYGDERRMRLEEGFNQLVNLVRIYRLDRTYSIFFCPKDRATWVQRGSRPQHPFRPDVYRESCGIRVTR